MGISLEQYRQRIGANYVRNIKGNSRNLSRNKMSQNIQSKLKIMMCILQG